MSENSAIDEVKNQIRKIIDDVGFRLYDMNFNPVTRNLRIFIDHKEGVTVDDCSMVGYKILSEVRTSGFDTFPYTLEVSSPGIERSLSRQEHFKWARGKCAELELKDRKLKGYIRDENEKGVKISTTNGETFIHYSEIIKAKIVEEISYGRRRNY